MKKLNQIGLDALKSEAIVKDLNILLASYSLFYQNVRGFHWNIKGEKFFELHLKFEELYNNLSNKIDDIAERILTLGGVPDHSFTTYLKTTLVPEENQVDDGDIAVKNIVETLQKLLAIQRKLLNASEDANDEGTNSIMNDYIREQEKLIWMYSASLDK
jgi:starvation-inducible DNA-binding protein